MGVNSKRSPRRRETRQETLADWGERRFLAWVRAMAGASGEPGGRALALSMGDDAARVRTRPGADVIVTTDAMIEDVHFRRRWISPRELGAKALAVNLSDLAAMAARPLAAFLSLGVPPRTPIGDLKAFFFGLRDAGRRWACPLAGGDLVRADRWTLTVTLLGHPAWKNRAVARSGAREGQTLYMTGRPGESAAGLAALRRGDRRPSLIRHHNRPRPRIEEAAALARACPDLAMLDLSDGLANDAEHLATESNVSIEIDLARLPISRGLKAYAREVKLDCLDWALYGGEDYELLFAARAGEEKIRAALRKAGLKTRITAIGRVVGPDRSRPKVAFMGADGRRVDLPDLTFSHFS